MRPERLGERQHSAADLVVLLAVICLALVTWSSLSDAGDGSLWKAYVSVLVAVLFALAALTRHPSWAVLIRFLAGGWMLAAPYLLKFADIAPTRWAYLAIGASTVTAALCGIMSVVAARPPVAVKDGGITLVPLRGTLTG